MNVLVTGGAGYVGSHTCVLLLEAGYNVTVIDNLCNSSSSALKRVCEITGRSPRFILGDIRNRDDLDLAFDGGVDAVIHFAALKAVGDSCAEPIRYFDNNIGGTICLMKAMDYHQVDRLVFSSSASAYGEPSNVPVDETAPLAPVNPYGRTKQIAELLISDWCAARHGASSVLLRYFNPVGAHPSGCLGEDPRGYPSNLMPRVAQVAAGRLEKLQVFGFDYPTHDGTGVRDYVHVMDLADAHVRAVSFACRSRGCEAINLGTGRGYSVLELVSTFKSATGRHVPMEFLERRPGDVAELTADPTKAMRLLGWKPRKGLHEMCVDVWNWQSSNPLGYDDSCENSCAE